MSSKLKKDDCEEFQLVKVQKKAQFGPAISNSSIGLYSNIIIVPEKTRRQAS